MKGQSDVKKVNRVVTRDGVVITLEFTLEDGSKILKQYLATKKDEMGSNWVELVINEIGKRSGTKEVLPATKLFLDILNG